MTLYDELQEYKDCRNLRINITKYVMSNVTHCFIFSGKELPIHYSTKNDVFHKVSCDVYLLSFHVLVGAMLFLTGRGHSIGTGTLVTLPTHALQLSNVF